MTVLDLVDSLIVAACPDRDARSAFVYRVLGPLVNRSVRSDQHTRDFSRQLELRL
jgi:hypothetical protein